MIIENELKTRKIRFIRIDSMKAHYPSHRIKIEIETENIKTTFDNYIWISEADIDKFILELESLDSTRNGRASLRSMSPDEMTLTLKPIDVLGHLLASIRFVKKDEINEDYSYDITVEFQIDPTSLPNVKTQLFKMVE